MARGRKRLRKQQRRPVPPRAGLSSQAVYLAVLAVGVLGVGLYFLARRAPDTNALPAPAVETPRPKRAPDPLRQKRNEARRWFDQKLFDARGRFRPLSGERIDAVLREGEQRGYDEIEGFDWEARKTAVYEDLLRREPYHPAANRALGRIPLSDYPDFRDLFRRMQDATALPPEFARFRNQCEAKIQTRPHWRTPVLSKEEFAKAKDLLDRFVAWDEKLRKDPTLKAIYEARARVRTDPLLGKYETVHITVPPFVLFYASKSIRPKDDTPLEKRRVQEEEQRLRDRLGSYKRLIEQFLAYFRATWMEPLELQDFESGQLFFVWVFGDRWTWEQYGAACGLIYPPGLLGYFNPRDHWVFLYEDRRDRVTVETSLAHELTHQLHWHFSKDEKGEFKNHMGRIKAVWFTEGWAEYAGWTKKQGDDYRFGQPSVERVRSLRLLNKLDLPLYPVRDLVRRESFVDWIKTALREWLPKQRLATVKPELLSSVLKEMLYAQSWLLVNFLYEYGGGKYRQKMLEFTRASLRGYLGHTGKRGYARAHEVFAQIFRLRTDADWEHFQKEYEEHLEAKLYEVR